MKNPDEKRPMPLVLATLLLLPAALGLSMFIAIMEVARQAGAAINYNFGYWTIGILFAITFSVAMRLASVAETYIWEYLALCKLLKTKGLGSWIKDAQKIRCLK